MNSGSWAIRGALIIDNDNRLCYCRNGNNERKRRGEEGNGKIAGVGWVVLIKIMFGNAYQNGHIF